MGPRTDARTIAAGIGMASIFGFSFLFTKKALAALSLLDLLAVRFTIAAGVMFLLAAIGLIRVDLSRRRWLRLLPLAAVQPVAYFFCETAGVKLTTASEAGVIIGSIPVVVAIMAAVFLRERPAALQMLFIISSSFGVALMVAGGGGLGRGHLGGLFLLLGAVLSAGFYSILSRRLRGEFSPMEITLVMMGAGAVVFNTVALAAHLAAGSSFPAAALVRPSVWMPLLYLGLLSSVAAFFLVNFMLSKLEATRTVAYTNLTSLVSLMAGVLILGERLHWHQWAGGVLILAGVWGTNRFARAQAVLAQPLGAEAGVAE
ncbi:MAG: DMT family transporter [Bacteroidota bacterium]